MTEHHTEAFTESFKEWGYQCFTCGQEEVGMATLALAEVAADEHVRMSA